jgi:hypothetical protein
MTRNGVPSDAIAFDIKPAAGLFANARDLALSHASPSRSENRDWSELYNDHLAKLKRKVAQQALRDWSP